MFAHLLQAALLQLQFTHLARHLVLILDIQRLVVKGQSLLFLVLEFPADVFEEMLPSLSEVLVVVYIFAVTMPYLFEPIHV